MKANVIEIRVSGKSLMVPSVDLRGRTFVSTGKWIKTAAAMDEDLVEGEIVDNPAEFVKELKKCRFKADILTFPEKLPSTQPKHSYAFEWDNWAAVPTASFDDWWKTLPQEARKNVRRSEKRGVVVKVVPFNDEFVKGIQEIYNESPMRQGRPFWHFGKDFETVKRENATYLERSEFIGAYLDTELIGFIKLVYFDNSARYIQILAKNCHQDKRPMNALVAKSVEVCVNKRKDYLIYSKFNFGNKTDSPLTEFKRRNGFQEMRLPRYYIPLTVKGKLAIKLKLHRGMLETLPAAWISALLRLREWYFRRKLSVAARENNGLAQEN